MKLIAPPLEIRESDGFKPELDIFRRKPYGESLFNLINNTQDELVVALDAPWGEGKSTFIKMWRGFLNEKEIVNIYFDAFENDYQEDPLLAISSELYQLIDKKDGATRKAFKLKTLSALKVVGRAGLKIGIKTITAGILDDTILETTDTVDDTSDETSELIDKFIEDQITKAEENRKSLIKFKEHLSELGSKLGNGKNIVFIIDELDRCKPKYALSILESIKHLFSVPHITFVLVINREQLEESVRCEYGQGIDAAKYLQKFVSIWTTLPKTVNSHNSVPKNYVRDCLKRMDYPSTTQSHQDAIEWFEELVSFYDMSLRDIEKSLTNFAIIHNARNQGDLNSEYLITAVFVSIIKTLQPKTYQKLSRKKITYDQLATETSLVSLKDNYWDEQEEHPLRWLIKYSLSDETIAKEMIDGLKNKNRRYRKVQIDTICRWLDSFGLE